MRETERVTRAARRAIARAKRCRSEVVTTDDLLVGLLSEVGRFGIAWIGEWAIDAAALSEERAGDAEPSPGGSAPAYAPETVRLFERGAELAREDDAAAVGVVHLLAAYGDMPSPLMEDLRALHGFSWMEWRAALARGAVGPLDSLGGAARGGAEDARSGDGRAPDLMSVDEAAAYLGVHSQTVRNYVKSGKLPAYRLAGERYLRVLRKDLLALLEPVPTEDAGASETPDA